MKLWKTPPDYWGTQPTDYYVFLGRCRDSDMLTDSNFEVALERLGGEDDDELVMVKHDTHWAVGWIEYILIHMTATEKIELAEEMLYQIEQYPLLDEDDHSRRQMEAISDYWSCARLWERIGMCDQAGISIFAARSEDPPAKVEELLLDNGDFW